MKCLAWYFTYKASWRRPSSSTWKQTHWSQVKLIRISQHYHWHRSWRWSVNLGRGFLVVCARVCWCRSAGSWQRHLTTATLPSTPSMSLFSRTSKSDYLKSSTRRIKNGCYIDCSFTVELKVVQLTKKGKCRLLWKWELHNNWRRQRLHRPTAWLVWSTRWPQAFTQALKINKVVRWNPERRILFFVNQNSKIRIWSQKCKQFSPRCFHLTRHPSKLSCKL